MAIVRKQPQHKLLTVMGLLAVNFVLSACGASGDPTPTSPIPTDTPMATVSDTPQAVFAITEATPSPTQTPVIYQRSTLPPSWTPTSTPTVTLTPTITLSPTITPSTIPTATLTNRAFCRDSVIIDFEADRTNEPFSPDDWLEIVLYADEPGTTFHFEITAEANDEVVMSFSVPSRFPLFDNIDLTNLPGPGTYAWEISVERGGQENLCARQGTLRISDETTLLDMIRRGHQPESTAEPTPE